MRAVVVLLCLAGCGRVNFGYPVVDCDEVTGSEAHLGPDDHCYVRNDLGQSWADSLRACNLLGGHLATVSSADENAVIASLVRTDPLRIGLTNGLSGDTSWEWGATSEAGIFENWASAEPMLCMGASSTVQIAADGTWSSICNFVGTPMACEIEPWLVDDTTGHGYRISWTDEPWATAGVSCTQMGGHLATLETPAERLFVAALTTFRSPWVGGTTTDGTNYTWLDGSSVVAPMWTSGEPDSGPGSCLLWSANQAFSDDSCSATRTALCERDE
jgi:hypothetical protein